jgi:hypothetical protein
MSGANRRYAQGALRHAGDRVACSQPGTRNAALNDGTYSLMRFVAEGSLTASEIAVTMAYAARQAGLLPDEIKATIASALTAGARG